jgi:LacI family transcriptional regulator
MAMVAKQAGVHTTSVSLALRNHPSLPLATRQRLCALAAQMGYHRDPALSALISYRRHSRPSQSNLTLAYVTDWDTRWGWKDLPAHQAFFAGATAKSTELGFRLEHFWLGEPGITHQRMSRILYSRGIKGLVLASHRLAYRDPINFDWARFSGVKIDFSPLNQRLHIVTNDQRTSASRAVQQARAAGYRRVGFVLDDRWDEFVDRAWSAGFLAEQKSLLPKDRIPILYFHPPPPGPNLVSAADDFGPPREVLAGWLREHRPEVIISYAPLVLPRLKELDIAVPRDIAFVEIFLQNPDGRTAGVQQNCTRVGELAVEILVGQLQQHVYGLPAIPTTTLVEGTWFDGASLPIRQPCDTAVAPFLPKPARTRQRGAVIPSRPRSQTGTKGIRVQSAGS